MTRKVSREKHRPNDRTLFRIGGMLRSSTVCAAAALCLLLTGIPDRLSAAPAPARGSDTAVFHPIADAEVMSNEGVDVNRGDSASLALQNGRDRDREIFLKFDVSNVGGNIVDARLKLFVRKIVKGDPKTPVVVWSTGADWDERTLTYRNQPQAQKQVAEFGDIPRIDAWMEADVTSVIRRPGVYSFRLAAKEGYQLIIPSRESGEPDLQPVLEITHGIGAVAPVKAKPAAAKRETVRRAIEHPQNDVWVGAGAAEPSSRVLVVNGSASAKETYLSFDLSGVNCDVLTAKLRLYYRGGGSRGATLRAYATYNGWTQDSLDWRGRPPAMPAAALAEVELPGKPGWMELDVARYITGTGSYSFILKTDGAADASFASNEAEANRPELAVTYQAGLNRSGPDVFASGERIMARYSDQRLARDGILDVTKPPYCADPTGKTDATLALQRALNDGRDARCVTFLPRGTYLVSDTLEGISPDFRVGGVPGVNFRRREFGCILKGASDPAERAVLRLAGHAPGFGDPDRPKPVVHFWAVIGTPPNVYEKSNTNFSQQILDVSVDLNGAAGNAGAIGVEFLGCEDTAMQGIAVNATGAFAGIKDGLGSGGGMHDITVTGGRYGAYITKSQPTCSLSHATFRDQTVASIYNNSSGPLVLPGAVLAPGAGASAIVMRGSANGDPYSGSVCLVDARIEMPPRATVPAITGNRSVYLTNTFVQNAATLVRIEDAGDGVTQAGNPEGWCQVREFAGAATVVFDKPQIFEGKLARPDAIYVDGARRGSPLADISLDGVTERDIPADLQSRHTWSGVFPWHDTKGMLNARDYGATGDGERENFTDQYPALQRAIDDASARNLPLFVPRGIYRLSKGLELKANTTLVGASHISTLLLPIIDPRKFPQGDFLDGANPKPIVRTVDDAGATTRIGLIGIYVGLQNPPELKQRFATNYAVLWRAGRNSIIRTVQCVRPAPEANAESNTPFFVFRGGGGGRAYGLKLANREDMTREFTNCSIEGTTEPLAIYHFQPQGASEGRCGAEITEASNVDIYGVKYEGSSTVIRLGNSNHIRIFGESGGGAPKVLFRVDNCRDFLLSNLYPMGRKVLVGTRSYVSDGAVATGDANLVLLYKRGNPGVGRPATEPRP